MSQTLTVSQVRRRSFIVVAYSSYVPSARFPFIALQVRRVLLVQREIRGGALVGESVSIPTQNEPATRISTDFYELFFIY